MEQTNLDLRSHFSLYTRPVVSLELACIRMNLDARALENTRVQIIQVKALFGMKFGIGNGKVHRYGQSSSRHIHIDSHIEVTS